MLFLKGNANIYGLNIIPFFCEFVNYFIALGLLERFGSHVSKNSHKLESNSKNRIIFTIKPICK